MHRSVAVILVALILIAVFLWFNQRQVSEITVDEAELAGTVELDARLNNEADISTTEDLRAEALRYIEEITDPTDELVEIDRADDFVNRDEPLSLFPRQSFEERTLTELDAELDPDAPITVVREQEQVEISSPREIIIESAGNLELPVKILMGGKVREMTVGEVLDRYPDPNTPISLIKRVEHLEVTTLAELHNNDSIAADETLKVIREPYRLKTTTVGELLMDQKQDNNVIFYVRNVTEDDKQGLWGIVHNGLVKNFASGIAIRRGEQVRNYQVEIPPGADERNEDFSSSFLGRMIVRKTTESYVYNYQNGGMGQNPDLIRPGQELVIIGFTPDELVDIYEHFVSRSES
ncbi:MAG: hypothetical protein WD572_10160 [Gammaproteobacteria bacterium]